MVTLGCTGQPLKAKNCLLLNVHGAMVEKPCCRSFYVWLQSERKSHYVCGCPAHHQRSQNTFLAFLWFSVTSPYLSVNLLVLSVFYYTFIFVMSLPLEYKCHEGSDLFTSVFLEPSVVWDTQANTWRHLARGTSVGKRAASWVSLWCWESRG